MSFPHVEFKLNIVSLANLGALVALLITAISGYSTMVSSWAVMERDRDIFKTQILELQKMNTTLLERIQNLQAQDSDIRISMTNLQAQLAGRLSVLEVELRQLNTTVSKIEGAVQSGTTNSRRR